MIHSFRRHAMHGLAMSIVVLAPCLPQTARAGTQTLTIGFPKAGFSPLEIQRRYADYYGALERCANVRLTNSRGTPIGVAGPELLSDDELIERLRTGKLSMALLPTGLTVVAAQRGLGSPIAARGRADTGAIDTYKPLLLVRADSPYKQPRDLAGEAVAHTSTGSFSGDFVPRALFPRIGLVPGVNYAAVYSKGHERSITGLRYGFWKGAAVAGDVFERMVANGEMKSSEVRVLWSGEPFPVEAWFVAATVSAQTEAKLRECTYAYRLSPAASKALHGADAFVPIDYDRDYAPVRTVILHSPKPMAGLAVVDGRASDAVARKAP